MVFYYFLSIRMKKLSYMALWLIGIVVALSVWVASADTPTVTHSTLNVVPEIYTLNWNTGFTAWTITVTDWTTTITILDRNLWATTTWTWCEDGGWPNNPSYNPCPQWDSSFWYHFQWWNNYWFPSTGELSAYQKSTGKVESGSISIPYSSPVFIYGWENDNNWLNDNIGNLWWWSENDNTYNVNNDTRKVTNATERKWPCPDGFHVPSRWELDKLYSMMSNWDDYATIRETVRNKLLMPYAGYRPSNNALVYNLGQIGRWSSSSPYSVDSTYFLVLDKDRSFRVDYLPRAYAFSVRCFYNQYTEYWAALPTEISSISITWITLPVGWATPTLVWIESQTDWVSVVQSRPFDGWADVMIRFDVKWWHEQYDSFIAWNVYKLYMPLVVANGYTLTDWYTASFGNYDATVDYNTNQLVFEFTATEPAPTTYTVTWKNWETVLETDENVVEWATPSYDGETPTKAATSSYTYSFKWWSKDGTNVVDLTTETITDNTTYTALFDETAVQQSSSSSSSWWGGWWWKTVTKTDTKTDETKAEGTKQDENKSEEKQEGNTENPENTQNDSQKVLEDGLTQEFHDAYDFAYKKWITTMPSAKEANMKGPLTRIAMAKMLSNYAINVLWKKPANKIVPKFPDIDEKLNEDYGWAVDLSYQLWIMWIWIEKFRPYDLVPRSEFGTALSRMLFGLEDGDGVYYETHLKKLKEEWIITNDSPNLQEARWYVMIMLMRSAK